MEKVIVKVFVMFGFLTVQTIGFSQISPLSVGDKCPDIVLRNMVNYKTPEAKISDFRGKLLILDFWATWCAPCISMMQVTDSLQRKYADAIQVLPVTMETAETVNPFLENMRRSRRIGPPSVTSDTLLNLLFPHKVIPRYVWIDQNGKVLAITDATAVTSTTIDKYFETGKIETAGTTVPKVIDEDKPIFVVGNYVKNEKSSYFDVVTPRDLLYHSTLTRYIDGFPCQFGGDSSGITIENESLEGLYRDILGHDDLKLLLLNRSRWLVKNPQIQDYSDSVDLALEKRPYQETLNWMKSHCFCYRLTFPLEMNDRKYDIALQDLNNYFGAVFHIKGGLEKVKNKCLVLKRTDNIDHVKSKGIEEQTEFNQFHLKIRNQPMYALNNFLSINMDLLPPLVDETGYTGKIDIDLNCNLTDLTEVNESLKEYGLQFVEEWKEIEMIVIRDADINADMNAAR